MRALRGEHKTADMTRAARLAGLDNWTTGHLANLEAGRASATLPMLFALSGALASLLGRPVALTELLAGNGGERVAIGDNRTVTLAELRASMTGQAVGSPVKPRGRDRVTTVRMSMVDADTRAARDLGLTDERAASCMAALWGRTLSAERDRRAGPDANAQKRGRIARDLKTELREAITDGAN